MSALFGLNRTSCRGGAALSLVLALAVLGLAPGAAEAIQERLPIDGFGTGGCDWVNCTVANLDDDPDAAGADWATASDNNTNHSGHFTFPTPALSLTPGAGLQEFRVSLRKNSTCGTGTPTANIELWENGSAVRVGTAFNVTAASSSQQVASFTWDATEITSSANVEIVVNGTKAGGAPAARCAVDLGAVEWNAETQVANTPPTVTITAPPDASTFNQGFNITFTGTASDVEDGDLTASLSWTSSIDGVIGSGGSFSRSDLSPGTHTITASVTDSGGLPGSDVITLTVNGPPTVTITAPPDASTFNQGDNITFTGTASDTEDGDLTASLSWSSSIDGAIGTGGSFSRSDLSPGSHTITASVTDSGGLPGSDVITITVNASGNTAPSVTITAPANLSSFDEGVTVNFTGTASDAEDGDITASLSWSSDQDGAVGSGGSPSSSTLSVNAHVITASVTDSGGLSGDDTVNLTINNVLTVVAITAPADLATFNQGDNITFSGSATDPNDTGVEASLSWNSSIDLAIGSGGSFSRSDLTPGSHTITASVNDPDDATLAEDQISITINAKPVVSITSPTGGADFLVGTSISFAGTATDAEDGTLTASLAWTSSINGAIGSGGSFSNSTLSIGTHTITASVTDSGGATGLAQLTITVSPPGNTAPSVSITSPTDAAVFTAGNTVNFVGTASDVEDGDLTANLSWTSSLQGTLGSGGSFSRNDLAVGTHVITASVTDSLGATGQDQVTITVNAPAAVNGTTAGTATAEASSCSQITVVARFTGDDDDDGFSTFTIAPSGTGCATVRGASPRRCIVSELTPGAYTLSVSFTDPDGVTGSPVTPTGSPVTVPACNGTDDAAPTLLVLAPMRDAVVTGTDRAKIQVYEPNLSTVEWMVDSSNDLDLVAATLNANYDCGADCAVYEFDLDTSGLSLGAHYFTVKATDTEGNVARITRAFRKPTSPGDSRLLRRTRGSQLCIDCHNLPTHSSQSTDSDYGNWAIECVDCHTPHQTSNIYLIRGQIETPNSGRRSVRFESRYGARKDTVDLPGQASFANEDAGTTGSTVDGVDGPCQVCHTRTKNPGDGKERWRNSSAGGNADNHFDDGRPTQICTVCHSHDSGFSPAGGACNACHVAPPTVGKHRLHDEVWDSTTGNLPTNYAEDVSHATPTQYGFSCAECHSNNTADHFPGESSPYTVDVLFKGTAPANASGSYAAGAAQTPDEGSVVDGEDWNWSIGTCSNLYCHSNANPTGAGATSTTATPTWDATVTLTCVSCHNTQGRTDSGNAEHLSTAHGKHIQSTSGETNTYTFKCDECHALTIRDNPNDPWNLTRAADFSTVAGRGKLQHVDGGKDVAFSATATAADSVDQSGGSYDDSGGSPTYTCSGTYCHSRGTSTDPLSFVAPFASLSWPTGTSSCESCHGGNAGATNKMATNAHTAHMNQATYLGKNFECAQCHDLTVDLGSDTSIPAAERPNHVNGVRNVSINKGGTYDGAFGCSNVYCHSSGQQAAVRTYYNPAAWNSGTTLANDCKACHGRYDNLQHISAYGEPNYLNGGSASTTANSHLAHVRTAASAAVCGRCHANTTATGTSIIADSVYHLDTTRDVHLSATYGGSYAGGTCSSVSCHVGAAASPTWGGGPYVCLNCHSGAEGGGLGDKVPNGVAGQWNNVSATGPGHGTPGYGDFASTSAPNPSAYGGCDYCHDLSAAHAPTAGVNPYRLRFSATDNSLCLQCHSVNDNGISANSAGTPLNLRDSSKDVLDTLKTTTGHFGAKHQTNEGGYLCWDCHDPHGVQSNILMMKTMVSITSDTYGVPTKTPADITPTPGPGVSFTARAAAGDFVKQIDSAYGGTPRAGICQACHEPGKTGNPLSDNAASTKYWRWDGSDDDLNQADNSFRLNSAHNKTLKCTQCHFHDANFKGAGGDCLGCHGLSGGAGTTGPNSRRPVRDDFGKNSHHVGASVDADGNPLFTQPTMGGALTNFDCVVCHAEGKLVADSVATGACISAGNPSACCTGPGTGTCQTTDTDGQPHQDAIINLRNTDSATVYYNYDKGAITGASNTWMSGNSNWQTQTSQALDPFCLSCHDFDGASATFNSGVNENRGFTGSTSNPFADSAVANEYDQVNRVSVVNIRNKVDAYVNDSNTPITPVDRDQAGEARGPDGRVDPTQGIYSRHAIRSNSPATFGAPSVYQADSNTSCTAAGTPYTCCTGSGTGTCEGIPNNRWVARPVGTTGSWNDNSVMGCADCHTTDGANTTAGNAHGSNTEYLLKNSDGGASAEPSFDIRNVSTPGINCYKCHARAWYSRDQRNLEHTDNNSDWAFTADQTGSANRRASNGNVFGLPCMTCHGGTDFGRIHGTSETLLINAGPATRKTYRFTNGASQRYFDPNNWTTTSFTCYTLTNAQAATDSWGGCAQHDQGGSGATYTRLAPRPLKY